MDDSLVGYTSDDNQIQLLQIKPRGSYEIVQKQAYILTYQYKVRAIQFHGVYVTERIKYY